MKVTMINNLRQLWVPFAAMPLHQKLDVLIEGTWLLLIFLLPVYFNLLCFYPFYFAKALALVILVSLLLGMVLAQWFLAPHGFKMGDLPSVIRKSPLQLAALLVGLMWVVSTVFSIMPAKSLWGNLAWSTGFLPNLAWLIFFMVIALRVKGRAQVFRALYALLISSGIVSLAGILQFVSPSVMPWPLLNGRVFSTDGNPLSLSAFLAMVMPVTMGLIILNWYGWGSHPRSMRKFAALLVLFVVQLCCLALAQYSVTLLLYIIGLFVFFALAGVFLQRRATLALSALAMLLVAVTAVILMGQVVLTENAGPPVDTQAADAPVAEQVGLTTLSIRVQNWRSAAEVIIDSPEIPFSNDGLHFLRRLIGYGPETFMVTVQQRFPAELKSDYTSRYMGVSQPENHYLYLGATQGILGLLAFLGLLTAFFIVGFRLLAGSRNREVVVLAAAFVAAVAQYCSHIFFNPSVINPELVLWTVLGLTAALSKIDNAGTVPDGASAPLIEGADAVKPRPGNLRKLLSMAIIIVFIAVGSGLTVPLMLANIKVRSGFTQRYAEPNLALMSFSEAIQIGPDEAGYHEYLGHLAFRMATFPKTDPRLKDSLLSLSELSGSTAIRIEPQLALWRYLLADREMYWVMKGSEVKNADILYLYQEADQLFPRNAVILNKWALALIMMRDYREAGQKLEESALSDPSWAQTSYLKGLLSLREGNIDQAGRMFVSPFEDRLDETGQPVKVSTTYKLESMGNFIKFCGQLTPYGETPKVRDALSAYVDNRSDDWAGLVLLGIANSYTDNSTEALASFKNAAVFVADADAELLAAVMEGCLSRYPDIKDKAVEIVNGLMERAARVP